MNIFFPFKYKEKQNINTIAMTNSGAIRVNELNGAITLADVLEVFPFENSIDYLELKGSTLRTVLERSAEILSPDLDEEITEGHFMQVSGKEISISQISLPEIHR